MPGRMSDRFGRYGRYGPYGDGRRRDAGSSISRMKRRLRAFDLSNLPSFSSPFRDTRGNPRLALRSAVVGVPVRVCRWRPSRRAFSRRGCFRRLRRYIHFAFDSAWNKKREREREERFTVLHSVGPIGDVTRYSVLGLNFLSNLWRCTNLDTYIICLINYHRF